MWWEVNFQWNKKPQLFTTSEELFIIIFEKPCYNQGKYGVLTIRQGNQENKGSSKIQNLCQIMNLYFFNKKQKCLFFTAFSNWYKTYQLVCLICANFVACYFLWMFTFSNKK